MSNFIVGTPRPLRPRRLVVFLAIGFSCSSPSQPGPDASSGAGDGGHEGLSRLDVAMAPDRAATDLATGDAAGDGPPGAPLPGCETFIACCTAPGELGSGVHDDECGSNGVLCQDCTQQGQRCRTKGDGVYFCTSVLPDGATCSGGWQCLGESCPAGVCMTPCVPLAWACQPEIGKITCCDPLAQCTKIPYGGANQTCCYPPGTILSDQNLCGHCCGINLCDFVSPGKYVCKP